MRMKSPVSSIWRVAWTYRASSRSTGGIALTPGRKKAADSSTSSSQGRQPSARKSRRSEIVMEMPPTAGRGAERKRDESPADAVAQAVCARQCAHAPSRPRMGACLGSIGPSEGRAPRAVVDRAAGDRPCSAIMLSPLPPHGLAQLLLERQVLLPLALLVDGLIGEAPFRALPHPVALIGRAVSLLDRRIELCKRIHST